MDALVETIYRRKNIDYKELFTDGLKPELTNMLDSSDKVTKIEVTKKQDLKRKRPEEKETESSTLKISLKDFTFLVESNTHDLAMYKRLT